MARRARIAVAASSLVAIPLLAWGAFVAWGGTPEGLRVDGAPLAPTRAHREELRRRAERWVQMDVRVQVDGTERRRTRRELGARIDVERLTRQVGTLGRSGRPWRDLPALWAAFSGATDLAWPVRVDGEAVRAFVRALSEELDRPARPAELDAEGRLRTVSADGLRVERAGATRALARALSEGRRAVVLPTSRVSSGVGDRAMPPLHRAPAEPIVIARFSTRLRMRGVDRDRAHNVRTAAGYLDGALIEPGARFSFNARVGARDRAHGYRDAHVIVAGEMVDGIGGGVCQVASTLHAAAFLAGLDIVEHSPHSRPSEYIAMGLDATVVWPNVDLAIVNSLPFPLRVRAVVGGGQLTVELYGARRAREVDWRTEVLASEEWSDRYVEDPLVPRGEERVSQRGVRGFLVRRERTMRDATGLRIEERRLRYPPTDRIVRVSPGTLEGASFSDEPVLAGVVPENPF